MSTTKNLWVAVLVIVGIGSFSLEAPQNAKPKKQAASDGELLPTGMSITPTAAKGSTFQPLNPDLPDLPQFTADHPVSTAVSPDGNTLLVLTSGYNRNNGSDGKALTSQSSEYIFIYDIRGPLPVKQQALKLLNAFVGVTWNPSGREFYVSGGVDDVVHVLELVTGQWRDPPNHMPLDDTHGSG